MTMKGAPSFFPHVENASRVLTSKLNCRACFARETLRVGGVTCRFGEHKFYRDPPAELDVACGDDEPHPADANDLFDPVLVLYDLAGLHRRSRHGIIVPRANAIRPGFMRQGWLATKQSANHVRKRPAVARRALAGLLLTSETRRMRRQHFAAATLGFALLGFQPMNARADDPAVRKFGEGTAASEQHDWQRAESLFEESIRLSPSVGAYFNRGYSLEQLNRYADAYRNYREAERLARVRDDPRGVQAREAMIRLRPNVHYVELTVPASVAQTPGLRIVVDGSDVPESVRGEQILSDNPVHEVVVTSSGRQVWKRTAVADHERITVEVGTPIAQPEPPPLAPRTKKQQDATPASRVVAIVTAGTGLTVLAVDGIVSGVNLSKFNSLKAARDTDCARNGASILCRTDAEHAVNSRSDIALLGNVLLGVGAGLVVAGTTLWLVTPGDTRVGRLSPWFGATSAGLSWSRTLD